MKPLTLEEMAQVTGGSGNCGSSGETLVIEATCALAGAFIGWGLTALNPLGAITGAKLGYSACAYMCHS